MECFLQVRWRHMLARANRRSISHESVLAEVKSLFQSPTWRPPTFPAAAMELLSLTEREDMEIGQAAEALGRDPVLAAQVVKRARSAAYAGRQVAGTLKEAVVRLGVSGTRNVALESAMTMSCFRGSQNAALRESLRRHSVAVAHLARGTAVVAGASPEQSFLCGLLHDLGSVATLLALEELSTSWEIQVDAAEMWLHLDLLHPEQSAAIARMWGMPDTVVDVLGHHHDLGLKGAPRTVASTVILAESFADELGHGFRVSGQQIAVESADQELLSDARTALMLEDDPRPAVFKQVKTPLSAALGADEEARPAL